MFQSLRARLIGICVAITTLSLVVLALVSFFIVRGNTLSGLDERIGQLTHVHAHVLTEWVQEKQRITGAIQYALGQADPLPFLRAAKQAGGFDDAYIGFADKRHVFLDPVDAGYDPTQRPWYQLAMQAGKPILTPPYVDATNGKLTLSFAEPAGPKGKPNTVVAADMYMDSVVQQVAAIHPMAKSFAFLLDGQSNILVHTQQELILKPSTALAPELTPALLSKLASEGGHAQAQIGGATQMLYAARVEGTPWVLAVAVDRDEATLPLRRLLQVSVLITVLCVLAAVVLVAAAVSHQLRRLAVVRDALNDIASGDGDLTRRLGTEGNDELTQIARAFNQFVDKIASVLVRIRDSSESVRLATSEIASGNQDLSSRTEQQASALEQTAAAMEQLTATVQQNAANAQQANQLAANASDIASHGGTVVNQVVQTMGGIDAASRKIVDIIAVIDGIAFQTNILALNAAVEAARAGEQGRGFAVVAGEVRTLAQRSAEAAKEIKQLIDDSVSQVSTGSLLVQDAGTTMQDVVDSVRRVTAIVSEISNASQEQSRGIAEIGGAVSQMDQGTQQNAALVEEATAAAQALQQQAHQLADAVAGFRLEGHHGTASSHPALLRG
ncbi:methyl-accepting chemotaxis protein [Comamonas sp. GB3 AK4-5]|uniref:methyl-accepting chemotaxis protein n=1 Tax=Comamonas sp. GB3 AK4-5 TaxID=3231487 RepID=UPI00351E2354